MLSFCFCTVVHVLGCVLISRRILLPRAGWRKPSNWRIACFASIANAFSQHPLRLGIGWGGCCLHGSTIPPCTVHLKSGLANSYVSLCAVHGQQALELSFLILCFSAGVIEQQGSQYKWIQAFELEEDFQVKHLESKKSRRLGICSEGAAHPSDTTWHFWCLVWVRVSVVMPPKRKMYVVYVCAYIFTHTWLGRC